MRRSAELETRLTEWANEYCMTRYENIGYPSRSWLHNAILYHGPAPQGLNPRAISERTRGDEVEEAVQALEKQQGGFRAGRVLRAEYWMPQASIEEKLRSLSHIGQQLSRTVFFDQLWIARVHVAAWLRIPASIDLPNAS
jgi:hypothetical protein